MKNLSTLFMTTVAFIMFLGLLFLNVEKSDGAFKFNIVSAFANGESSDTCKTDCDPGGCGSSQCTISQFYPTGMGSEKSVTAQDGYYACCWKTALADLHAESFPNSCCAN